MSAERVASADPAAPFVLLLAPSTELRATLTDALSPACKVLQASERTLGAVDIDAATPGAAVLDDADGPEAVVALFERVRNRWPHVRAIVLVSTRNPAEVAAFDSIRGSLLVKPFEAARLVSLVRHQVRMSGMTSGVRRLADASVVRRLPGKT